MTPLEELQALVHARSVLDGEIEDAVGRALAAGVKRSSVAFALGISRASLYRNFACVVGKGSGSAAHARGALGVPTERSGGGPHGDPGRRRRRRP